MLAKYIKLSTSWSFKIASPVPRYLKSLVAKHPPMKLSHLTKHNALTLKL